jgi:hypothetical protein
MKIQITDTQKLSLTLGFIGFAANEA